MDAAANAGKVLQANKDKQQNLEKEQAAKQQEAAKQQQEAAAKAAREVIPTGTSLDIVAVGMPPVFQQQSRSTSYCPRVLEKLF